MFKTKLLMLCAILIGTVSADTKPPAAFTNAISVPLPGNPELAHVTFSQDGTRLMAYMPVSRTINVWSLGPSPQQVASIDWPGPSPDGIAAKDSGHFVVFNSEKCFEFTPDGAANGSFAIQGLAGSILCHSFNPTTGILTLGTSSGVQQVSLQTGQTLSKLKNVASGQIITGLDVVNYGSPIGGVVIAYARSVLCAGDPNDFEKILGGILPNGSPNLPVPNLRGVNTGATIVSRTSMELGNSSNPRILLSCNQYAGRNQCQLFVGNFQSKDMTPVTNVAGEAVDSCVYSRRYGGFVVSTHQPAPNGLTQYWVYYINPNKPSAPVQLDSQVAAEYGIRISSDDDHALVTRRAAKGQAPVVQLVTLP